MSRLLATMSLVLVFLLSGCKVDPASPDYWKKVLGKARRSQDQVRVIETLRSSGKLNESFLPFLHEQLESDEKPDVKAAVARALGDVKNPASVEPLGKAVDLGAADSATNLLNKELASALGEIGDPKAAPMLLKLLKARDTYTRIEAVDALGRMHVREAVEPLMQMATDEGTEPFLNKKAIEALGRIGDARAVPVLMRMLTKERRGISFYVESSFSLFQMGQPAADALLAVLQGKDPELSRWVQHNGINPASYSFKAAEILGDLREHRAEAALVQQLTFRHEDPSIQAGVRARAADALARMRSAAAVKPLVALVSEPDSGLRREYAHALARLGGREALPALERAAGQGDWNAREAAIDALTMLGDARELPLLEKLAAAEPAKTAAECTESGGEGCDDPAALGKKHAEELARHGKRLEAAKACEADTGCWAKKLEDADKGVVERAALEVGRGRSSAHLGALLARMTAKDPDTRMALILAAEWLVEDTKDAAAQVRSALPTLEKQLTEEKSRTEYVRANEDLRRLVARLQRQKI
ncbi:HEAT repeat domain-containing protein [Vitiosangium sp. GDMCC 1.1324]|uniref:HEAT repeat domain-containing protein n=1 Tax=Vitiosangium sp. (strain GDMCC 1.1324) TaxID=2138576 RepID=UPI000D3C6617|nr:HEAT repeat domain-containing protein [Vitiosangium sp. GDMCC 1.1324]PTL78992.1 PBS lyase [Vitiosangium sp. GDMCC 1.1324]